MTDDRFMDVFHCRPKSDRVPRVSKAQEAVLRRLVAEGTNVPGTRQCGVVELKLDDTQPAVLRVLSDRALIERKPTATGIESKNGPWVLTWRGRDYCIDHGILREGN